MAVNDVTGNLKSHRKPGKDCANDKETGKIDAVKILGVEKQIWDAQVLAKVARDHCDQQYPRK